MNPLSSAQSFIFGDGKNAPTYESLRKRREIVDLLKRQAVGGEYRNWGDGVGGLMKALGARMMDNKLAPQEADRDRKFADILAGLGGGGFGAGPTGPVAGAQGGFTGAGFSGTPESMPAASGQPTGGYRDAIASIESAGSGDYAAMGPEIKGDRAYGKYQVMGANIPEWSQAALGQSMTPEAFLANPEAQDAVFDHRFGGYADKYGPEGAAKAWFSGEGGMDNPNASDGNLTNDQYAAKFMGELGGGNPGMDMMGMAGMGEPDMSRLTQLAEVATYGSESQRMIAQALIQREIGKGDGGDALGWAALAQRKAEFAQGSRAAPKYYGNVQWADRTPDDGVDNPVPYQIGSDGRISWVDEQLGGAKPLPPVTWQDTGTARVPTGPGAARVGDPLAIDNAGKAAATEVGKSSGLAAANLGNQELNVNAAIDHINRIVGNDQLPTVTGSILGRLPANPLNQKATNLVEDIKGLNGKVFVNAIDALKGLGAMTELEGTAAKDALANITRIRDDGEFKLELERFAKMLQDKLEVARQKAGMAASGTPSAEWPAWMNDDPSTWTDEQLEEAGGLIGGR
jgi:hypothetical protein